jgi:hypothetical protein
LKVLRPAHLRVDLRLSDPNYVQTLERSVKESVELRAPLHVAAVVTDDAPEQLRQLRAEVDRIKPNVSLWLVFHESEEATSERWLTMARDALQTYAPGVLFAGGTLDGSPR